MPTKPTEPSHPEWNQGVQKRTTAEDPFCGGHVCAGPDAVVLESGDELFAHQDLVSVPTK